MSEQDAAGSSFSEDHHPLPAAQAQASLLIVESLIHSLMDSGLLTRDHVLDLLDSAADVKEDSAGRVDEPRDVLRRSLALIHQMRNSIAGRPDAR